MQRENREETHFILLTGIFLEVVGGLGPNSSASKHYTATCKKQGSDAGTINLEYLTSHCL